jgi:hypothetical protein
MDSGTLIINDNGTDLSFTFEEMNDFRISTKAVDLEFRPILISLLESHKIQKLIFQIEKLFQHKQILIEFNTNLGIHGAFDPDSQVPHFLINQLSGLTEANLAHEFIHAILFKKGFPTIPKIYPDERNIVLREIGSNILHISLVSKMKKLGININAYSGESVHPFRSIPSTCSRAFRPVFWN